jgi:type VI secretion system secreted protein VgrG
MAYTQVNRRIAISTPLGKDVLLLRGFTGSEAISQPFQFDLDLLSENDSIKFQDIVGQNVTLRLFDTEGKERHWNGFITRFSQGARSDRLTQYHARMEPWLWFLTRKSDCRIFQSVSAPDIIQSIFKELGFHDVKFRLYGTFEPREYCVQYRETDFNFVSRLMEEEGICYYFLHDDGKHTMVLANDLSAHDPCPVQSTARYDTRPGALAYEDTVTEWQSQEEFRSGAWAQTDYNFETPSASLGVSVNGKNSYEIFDYTGEYRARGAGDRVARIRLQEQRAPEVVCHGAGACRSFSSGSLFTLKEHYRSDQNQQYLLTSVHHAGTQGGDYEAGSGDSEITYHNSFECIPSSTPFRPARVTPEPVVQGCQTAVVVGPGGEEIYTDKYGRVKVQFFWDRQGKKNANSSCWMRVSYPWAGQQWGAIHIPRIGQEVIVGFLEGDPDQPIIVGRVYNAEQMPPFPLPGKAVISGVKSNSTKGGGGFNEISMDDTKGNELINIHAQFDQQKKVERDERVDIGRDRTEHVRRDEKITIDHDRTEEVKHDETIKIGNDKRELVQRDRTLEVDRDKTETVIRNKTIQVGGNQSEKIDGAVSIVIGKTLSESVLLNYAETVVGAMEMSVGGALAISVGGILGETVAGVKTETIGAAKAETIGGSKSLTIAKDYSQNIAGAVKLNVAKDLTEQIAGKHREETGKEFMVSAKKIELTAEDEIHIKAGSAELILKKNGDITIKGNKINLQGDGDVVIKGSKVKAN